VRDWNAPGNIKQDISRLNRIRREEPAFHQLTNLSFMSTDYDAILAYRKWAPGSDLIVVVNLDPHHVQSGWVKIPLEPLNLGAADSYQAHDLLTGARFLWHGARNYVQLDPKTGPAHVLRLRRRIRREQDFDYFM